MDGLFITDRPAHLLQQYNGGGIMIRNCIPPHLKELKIKKFLKNNF